MLSSQILHAARSLRAMVVHPADSHAQELVDHLSRIGCRTETVWPPPGAVDEHVDILFLEIKETVPEDMKRLLREIGDKRPTLVGLISYENPSVLQSVLDLHADAVVTKPLRPHGLLTSMVMARRVWQERRAAEKRIKKLKEQVKSSQNISRAKFILMHLHKISEDEAYKRIRTQAMAKRVTTSDIAEAIINADGILGFNSDDEQKETDDVSRIKGYRQRSNY